MQFCSVRSSVAVALASLVPFGGGFAAGCGGDDAGLTGGEPDSSFVDGAAPARDAQADATTSDAGPVDGGRDGATDSARDGSPRSPIDAGDAAAIAALPLRAASSHVQTVQHFGSSFFVAGSFDRVSPYSARNLLAVDGTGAALPCSLDAGFDGATWPVVAAGTSLYVGGAFGHYKDSAAPVLAKLDTATCALDPTFQSPFAVGQNVRVLAIAGDSLFVGGILDRGNEVMKLDRTTGAVDPSFHPSVRFGGSLRALVVAGSSLYVAGESILEDDQTTWTGVVKLDTTTGAADTGFQATLTEIGSSTSVNALAMAPGALYIASPLDGYSDENFVAKLDPATGVADPSFGSRVADGGAASRDAESWIWALATDGTSLYVGGQFTTYRGQAVSGLVKVDANSGAVDPGFAPAASEVYSLTVATDALYAGGTFPAPPAGLTSAIARLDKTTGQIDRAAFTPPASATSATPGLDGVVGGIALVGGNVWLGGGFGTYGGTPALQLAKVDDTTRALDPIFRSPFMTSAATSGQTFALAESNGALYASSATGGGPTTIVKMDEVTEAVDPLFAPDPNVIGGTGSLVTGGSSLYASDAYDVYKLDAATGAVDPRFTALAADGGGLSGTGGPADGVVHALAYGGSAVFAGGGFQAYAGIATGGLVKLDAATGQVATAFAPPTGVGFTQQAANGTVFSLLADGTSVYVGGSFDAYRGARVAALVKVDAVSGVLDPTFHAQLPTGTSSVAYISLGGGALFVEGSISYATDGSTGPWVVRLDAVSGESDAAFAQAVQTVTTYPTPYGRGPLATSGDTVLWTPALDGANAGWPLLFLDGATGQPR